MKTWSVLQKRSLAGDAVACKHVATRSGATEKEQQLGRCDSRRGCSCRNGEQAGATDHLSSIESDDPEFPEM